MNCVWITLLIFLSYLYYYVMLGTMERTGYNYGTSMLIGGAHEAIAYGASIFLVDKIDKRKGLLFCTIVMILCGLSFLLEAVKTSDGLQSVVISLTSLLNIFIIAYLSIIEMETYSIETRTIALAVSNGLGDIAVILQPFIVNWINGLYFHPAILCAGTLILFGIFPIFLIKLGRSKKKWQLIISIKIFDNSPFFILFLSHWLNMSKIIYLRV